MASNIQVHKDGANTDIKVRKYLLYSSMNVYLNKDFLWSGSVDKIGMTWICWKSVCNPKEFGGLDIKEVGVFNRALITK